jgi:3-phenylpropionate/cinnamic acid dioxygenase small subunit
MHKPSSLNGDEERAIVALLFRYAAGIDRRDWPLFASCFTADLETDYGALGQWHGRDPFVEHMRQGHANLGRTLHRITNYEITGNADEAAATCYVDALLMRQEPSKAYRQAHGWYEDQLIRDQEGWKIARRKFTAVMIQDLSR